MSWIPGAAQATAYPSTGRHWPSGRLGDSAVLLSPTSGDLFKTGGGPRVGQAGRHVDSEHAVFVHEPEIALHGEHLQFDHLDAIGIDLMEERFALVTGQVPENSL